MFEAHIYSQAVTASDTTEPEITADRHYFFWHPQYRCNLPVWIAGGKRQSQQQFFLFIEFRNGDGSHGYRKLEIGLNGLNYSEISQQVAKIILPDSFDPIKTERWLRQYPVSK